MAIKDILLPLVGEPNGGDCGDRQMRGGGRRYRRPGYRNGSRRGYLVRPKVTISPIWTIRRRPKPCAAYRMRRAC